MQNRSVIKKETESSVGDACRAFFRGCGGTVLPIMETPVRPDGGRKEMENGRGIQAAEKRAGL